MSAGIRPPRRTANTAGYRDAPRLRKETDLAIRDFYTFQSIHGEPDGRMEQVLQKAEGRASSALRRVTSTVTWGRPITPEDMTDLCDFTAFQVVRGLRRSREIELMSDLYVCIMQLNAPGTGRSPPTGKRSATSEPLRSPATPTNT